MVLIELCPDDVITFEIEDMSHVVQSLTAISSSGTVDNALVIFEVTMNQPEWSMCNHRGTWQVSRSEFGIFCFLSPVSGYYFLVDHILVIADVISGSAANDFGNLPMTEKAESVWQHFLTHSGTFWAELSVKYHFST